MQQLKKKKLLTIVNATNINSIVFFFSTPDEKRLNMRELTPIIETCRHKTTHITPDLG